MSSPPPGRFFHSVLWVAASRLIVRSLGLVSIVVLARLLSPLDFGLVALAMSMRALMESFTQFGFAQALIHYQDATDHDYATGWTLNALRGLILCVLLALLAYPLGIALDEHRLWFILPVLALAPLIEGFENPRLVVFEKALRFEVLFRLMVAAKIAGVAVAIAIALIWQSYWALVVGVLGSAVARTSLSFLYAPGHVWPELSSFRKLMRFSGWVSGAEILNALGNRMNPLLLGYLSSPQTVGYFHMTNELSWTTFNEIAAPLRRVLFPALSRHQVGSPAFTQAYSRALAGLFMVVAPVTLGFALTAEHFVPLVLGQQWLPIVVPIQWWSGALSIAVIGRVAQSAVMAAGRTKLMFQRNLIVVPVRLTLFVTGTIVDGLHGAIVGIVAGMAFQLIVNVRMGAHVTGISSAQHFLIPSRSWLALAAMAAIVGALELIMDNASTTGAHAIALTSKAAVGAAVYMTLHLLLWRRAGRPEGAEWTVLETFKNRLPIRAWKFITGK